MAENLVFWRILGFLAIWACGRHPEGHSSHHTKFQPERWLPDPVRARFDVFWPDSGLFSSHNCAVVREQEALWLLNSPNCVVVQQQQPLCGCHTASVWLPHRGHVHGTARHGHGTGTGGARKVWRHCRPRLSHTHTHTPKIATPRCGGTIDSDYCTVAALCGCVCFALRAK